MLDEDIFHPDYSYNVKPYCSPDKYYNEINEFFKNLIYEIVIAIIQMKINLIEGK